MSLYYLEEGTSLCLQKQTFNLSTKGWVIEMLISIWKLQAKAVYIFGFFQQPNLEPSHFQEDIMQLRKRYETRSAQLNQPLSRPHSNFILTNVARNRYRRSRKSTADVFYSDEEHSQSNKNSKQESQAQVQENLQIELNVEDQVPDDSDSKIQDVMKNCRPPPRKTRKCKKTRGLHSRPKPKEGYSKTESDNRANISSLNQNSEELQSQTAQTTQIPQPPTEPQPEPQIQSIKQSPAKQKLLASEEKMIDEKQQNPKNIINRASKECDQTEEKLRALAKMNFNPENNLKCPFQILSQYRTSFEKHLKSDYRDYQKSQQTKNQHLMRQKMNFVLLKQAQYDHTYPEIKSDSEDQYRTYRDNNDLLFQKCKQMTKEQQLQYLKNQFVQMVRVETDRKKQEILHNSRIEKVKRLNIAKTFNEVISLSPDRGQKFNGLSSSKVSDNNSQKKGETQKGSIMNQEIKIEMNQSLLDYRLKTTKISSIDSPSKPQVNIQQHQQYPISKSRSSQQVKSDQKNPKKKLKVELPPKSKSPQNIAIIQIGEKKDTRQIKSYNRNKILAQINMINRKCAEAEKQIQVDQQKKQTSRTNSVNSSRSIHGEVFRDKHDQMLSYEVEEPRNDGFGEIEIRTQQVSEKTEQQTRPDHLSFDSKDSYKDNQISGTIWSGFSRGGPKVKRLQILNRYHYNPFEETNGEDQCQLWKRLMSDEVEDIKSYYKFQDANEYDCLFNQFDRIDKGNSVVLKVNEQDFYVPHYYDPIKKCLVEEAPFEALLKGERRGEDSQHVTEIDRYLFPNKKDTSYGEKKPEDEFDIRKSYAAYQVKMNTLHSRSRDPSQQQTEMVSQKQNSEYSKQMRGLTQIKQEPEQAQESIQKSFNYSQLQDLDVSIKKEINQREHAQIHLTEINATMRKENSKEDEFDII